MANDTEPIAVTTEVADPIATAPEALGQAESSLATDNHTVEPTNAGDADGLQAAEAPEVAETMSVAAGESDGGQAADEPPSDATEVGHGMAEAVEAPVATASTDSASESEASPKPTAARAEPPADGGPSMGGMEGGSLMAQLLAESGMRGAYRRGDDVEGVVVRKDKDCLVLDIGTKQEAIVPANDLARLSPEFLAAISVGDHVRGVILRPEGEVVVSLSQALQEQDWDQANELLASGDSITLSIAGVNRGGAVVHLGALEGFVPRSQLVANIDEAAGPAAWQVLVGRPVTLKVLEVNSKKRRLILSERQAQRERRSEQKAKLMSDLVEGQIREGAVSAVTDFGAFVDLGGADGLVHVSEISHERGRHPRDLVKVGDRVKVMVLSVDPEKRRIALSMRRLVADPWESVEQDHYVGELVEATVSNLSKFGAFARLDDGLEGLIHVSELSDERIEHPREAVQAGQRLVAEIIAINRERQRLGLSVRRVPAQLRLATMPSPSEEPDQGDEPDEASAPQDE